MSNHYVFNMYMGSLQWNIDVTPQNFATVAYEEAIMKLPGGFDRWRVDREGLTNEEKHHVSYVSTDGEFAFGKLAKLSWPSWIDDFDEEDKPPKGPMFTIFGIDSVSVGKEKSL